MTIHVPHPRLLLAAIFAIALLGGGYAVLAAQNEDNKQVTPVPVGSDPQFPQVSAQESAAAQKALTADPAFAALVSGQGWKVQSSLPNTSKGTKVGFGLVIALDRPVDSSGPWKQIHCQGTVTETFLFPYQGVQLLGAVFSQDGSVVTGLAPLPSPSLTYDPNAAATPIDSKSCPKGSEDESN